MDIHLHHCHAHLLCGNCSFLLLALDHSRSTWTACTPSSRASGQQGLQENEIQMHHMHITAMNVAIIRMGGYVNINDPITELDWDNWHYVERNNKTDDFRK